VIAAIDTIVSISNKAQLPLIANDPMLSNKGVLLAYGSDDFESGKQLGNMIADLIEGKKQASGIEDPKVRQLKINKIKAAELNIKIPEELARGQ
jgi:ABC-type uncharacterized transport system substrate-binding protein